MTNWPCVAYQVQAGGHPVAENKIRQRDHRLWTLVAEAILRCPQATVYDNSGSKGPRIVAAMTDGFVVDSPTGRTGHRRRIPRVGRCHGSPVNQHHSWHRGRCR